jgi:hypothetical protein
LFKGLPQGGPFCKAGLEHEMKITVRDVKTGAEKTMPVKHAEILYRIGRVEYMTRDMVPAPPQGAPVPELDSAGTAWSADFHVATKLKNADGTWRKKPGAARD